MSDSDDTDILLLIPPDFFLTEANASLNYDSFQSQLRERTCANASDRLIFEQSVQHSVKHPMDPSKSYFTPTKPRCEHQSFANRKYDRPSPHIAASFSSPYDSSKMYNLPSSTPYTASKSHLQYSSPPKKHDSLVLDRVDRYLGKCSIDESKRSGDTAVRTSLVERRSDVGTLAHDSSATKKVIETPANHIQRYVPKSTEDDILNSLVSNKMSDWNSGLQKSMTQNDEQLISLASVWDDDERVKCDAVTTAATAAAATNVLQEQELRIRQCERTIQNLQSQLKQYQDKCSDAIKMDQTKNDALARLHETNSSLISNISQLESQLSNAELKFHRQTNDLKAKCRQLQEENEQLERKANGLLLTTNEVREINRKQLNEAETRLANSKHVENQLSEELSNLKTKFAQLQNVNDDDKRHVTALQLQLSTLQKTFNEKEEKLRKEIDEQRTSLKNFYQVQLDEKVNEKLKEFQQQLDSTEETIRKDFRQSERTIAERAIKQIELISQKNEQEFALLQEKHEKEIELYRIQLGNATKLIGQLEQSLSVYKVKRCDIAERLHGVVETQWQKTLEILSNTEPPKHSIDTKTKQLLDELSRMGSSVVENETAANRQILSKKENSAKFNLPNTSKIKRTNIVG